MVPPKTTKGTKVFALTGKIAKGGLVEIPMGMSVGDVVFGVGGGMQTAKAFEAVRWAASGGCIPLRLIDTVIDYRSPWPATERYHGLRRHGGHGRKHTCMVDMARFFPGLHLQGSCEEVKLHCPPSAQADAGNSRRITDGSGPRRRHRAAAAGPGQRIKNGSLCGGQTAPTRC